MKSKLSGALALIVICLVLLNGCKEPDSNTTASIVLVPKWGNSDFALNTLYPNTAGDSLRFSKMKLFLSEISLIKSDGSKELIKDIAYFNMTQSDPTILSATSSIFPPGDYTGISFNCGITDAQNNTDPTQVSCPNPLCADNEMYWGATLKYTYTKIEGNVKRFGSSLFSIFIYHVGLSANRRTISLQKPLTFTKDANNQLKIDLDIRKILDGNDPLNMATDYNTQTTDNYPLATRFADNIATAFSIE